MDIVPGTDPTGKPMDSYLRVGQDATVVVRVRQSGESQILIVTQFTAPIGQKCFSEKKVLQLNFVKAVFVYYVRFVQMSKS